MVNVASDRRYRGIRCCFTLLILTVAAAGSAVAQADTLSLGTGNSAAWNRDTQPLSSPVIQLLVSNSDNDLNAILYGVTLGLSFQPVGGATGSLQVATRVKAPVTVPTGPLRLTVGPESTIFTLTVIASVSPARSLTCTTKVSVPR
jgi:hypothetical protein